MKKTILFLMTVALVAVSTTPSIAQQGIIALDSVSGLFEDSKIPVADEVVFWIKFTNDVGVPVEGVINGFRIFSSDSATWSTTSADCNIGSLGADQFDLIWGVDSTTAKSTNGSGADTVALRGATMLSKGMPIDYNSATIAITIGPIDTTCVGKSICLDSCFYPPSGVWMWTTDGSNSLTPRWDGPHCFKVEKYTKKIEIKADSSKSK